MSEDSDATVSHAMEEDREEDPSEEPGANDSREAPITYFPSSNNCKEPTQAQKKCCSNNRRTTWEERPPPPPPPPPAAGGGAAGGQGGEQRLENLISKRVTNILLLYRYKIINIYCKKVTV